MIYSNDLHQSNYTYGMIINKKLIQYGIKVNSQFL